VEPTRRDSLARSLLKPAAVLAAGDALYVVPNVEVPASSSDAATFRIEQCYDCDIRRTVGTNKVIEFGLWRSVSLTFPGRYGMLRP
jgi:hypothetical protein